MNERRFAVPRAALSAALTCALAGVVSPAHADAAASVMREIQLQSRHTYRYTCANGKTFRVTYLNATNGQSFALVPVGGRNLLLVATVSGSGVRYQADRYTWWTKGPRADLYDAMAGENAQPVVAGCATIMR
ncbi:membrane-bound lysozyme inhibitor of c-type lysozyme MliC [Paraburkholderia caballeronis]|uniref:MliC family protein n=1 Tax=Paraburkholderia caballeronis TaxID=416943 RepID=UPI00106648BC|nr:MliC family protein [Paraburkholderia caballeronis]TDV32789.1 membrane-bound lysozyme inhibitor of c-type lysozyme MliC [Paraburkholderia caballeronis]